MSLLAPRSGQDIDNAALCVLTDEQIEELLKEAEDRLHAKAGLEPLTQDSEDVLTLDTQDVRQHRQIHFPKLEHNLNGSSYINNHSGVAKTSSQLMVPAEQRKMAEVLRSVTKDGKSSSKVVRSTLTILCLSCMRTFNPNHFLDAHQRLFLSLPCYHEGKSKS